jgi:hypothetical protein
MARHSGRDALSELLWGHLLKAQALVPVPLNRVCCLNMELIALDKRSRLNPFAYVLAC